MRFDRINEMEQYVLQCRTVSLEDMANHFEISMSTLRRDVNTLLSRGHIRKVYGGVAAIENFTPVPMSIRSSKNQAAKQSIGLLAATLVEDNQTIFLDSGSTILCLLPHLEERKNVTIVTHSLSAMYEASKYPNLNVIALGGLYSPSTNSYVGISTLEALDHISLDTVFIAATGISLERGLTNTTYFEAEIKRRVVLRGSRVVLLADHTKFDFIATLSFFDFKDLYAVVTDKQPSQAYMNVIHSNHIRLLCDSETIT